MEKPEQSGRPAQRPDLGEELPGLRLMPVAPALALVGGAAVVLLTAVIVGGLKLLGVEGMKPEAQVSAATLLDLLKIAFAVVAGLGGLVALVVAYRRQKVAEAAQQLAEAAHVLARQGEDRAHRAEAREATKLHNDRFATASGQLGHDSPAVRLAGVHALAGLADDAPTRELRQTCIDVLCAYLRMPYAPQPADGRPDEEKLTFAGLREVRHTIIRLITAHLRDGATVSWQGHDLDFTGVVFDGGDFSGAIFSGGVVRCIETTFSGGTVYFAGASFSGGTVFFTRASFSGSTVYFTGATFSAGEVSFSGAAFSGSTIRYNDAAFSGGLVHFTGATFSDGSVVNLADPRSWTVPPTGLPNPTPTGLLLPPQNAGT